MTDGLPFLPGNNFLDQTKNQYHRAHTLDYRNGYAMKKQPTYGIGGAPISRTQLSESELAELSAYNPILTYGQVKRDAPPPFIPAYVTLDKKILKFRAVLKGTVHGTLGPDEPPRHVDILYHLVDDTMLVVDKSGENSGVSQGKLLNRQRMPKNDVGDVYNWRDLNLGKEITLYARVFYIYDCDPWTREWLESEGVIVNDPIPQQQQQQQLDASYKLQLSGSSGSCGKEESAAGQQQDKLRRFLDLDGQVLRFYCVWDDRDEMFGELRKFILHYYLVNDTLEVREVHTPNDGRDPFPLLISRQRVPKNRYDIDLKFPLSVLELTDKEVKEYFSPRDFGIGKTVQVYNRKFFIYDCDEFTRQYYRKHFGLTDFTPAAVDERGKVINRTAAPEAEADLQLGGGDKTIHSCRTLLIGRANNQSAVDEQGVVLRYEAIYDSTRPHDAGRRFIISLSLPDNMISIFEPPVKNSGIIAGKFLEKSKVAKPGSPAEKPEFYSAGDFYVGAVIDVYRHRFIVTNADAFVLKYMLQHPELYTDDSVEKMREVTEHRPSSALRRGHQTLNSAARSDIDDVVAQVRSQLKRLDITSHSRKDHVFLGVEMNRAGHINRENIRDMCRRQNLPTDDIIVDQLARKIGRDPDRITLEELRAFLEEP